MKEERHKGRNGFINEGRNVQGMKDMKEGRKERLQEGRKEGVEVGRKEKPHERKAI
jgi:hypothetical protein